MERVICTSLASCEITPGRTVCMHFRHNYVRKDRLWNEGKPCDMQQTNVRIKKMGMIPRMRAGKPRLRGKRPEMLR